MRRSRVPHMTHWEGSGDEKMFLTYSVMSFVNLVSMLIITNNCQNRNQVTHPC